MSKKGAKQDDLIEAVLDDRVIAAILTRLTSHINTTIEAMFFKLSENFAETFKQTLREFAVELVEGATSPLISKISLLEEENKKLNQRVNDLENIGRLENVIIYGLPESPPTSTSFAAITAQQSSTRPSYDETVPVLELCRNRLGLEISETQISFAHRISRGVKEKNRPILVGFSSRRARDQVYSARKNLRLRSSSSGPNQIYINEHLTKSNAHIYAMTRKMVREKQLHSTWSSGGLIYIRKTNAPDERPRKVNTMNDLDQPDVHQSA